MEKKKEEFCSPSLLLFHVGQPRKAWNSEKRTGRGKLCERETDFLGQNVASEIMHVAFDLQLEVVPELATCFPQAMKTLRP